VMGGDRPFVFPFPGAILQRRGYANALSVALARIAAIKSGYSGFHGNGVQFNLANA